MDFKSIWESLQAFVEKNPTVSFGIFCVVVSLIGIIRQSLYNAKKKKEGVTVDPGLLYFFWLVFAISLCGSLFGLYQIYQERKKLQPIVPNQPLAGGSVTTSFGKRMRQCRW